MADCHRSHLSGLRGSGRFVGSPPGFSMPALAQELRLHLAGRTRGYLFESNRHGRYSQRTIQKLIRRAAKEAGLELLSYPPATALPDPSTSVEGSSISSPRKASQAASSSASPGSARVWRWKR